MRPPADALKPGKHFQMSLQYSYLTTSAVSSTSLLFQVPF